MSDKVKHVIKRYSFRQDTLEFRRYETGKEIQRTIKGIRADKLFVKGEKLKV